MGVVLALGIALVNCSGFRREERAPWRREAELACLKSGVVKETPHIKVAKALEGPGICGADFPLKVRAFAMEGLDITASAPGLSSPALLTRLNREETLVCPMVSAIDRWLEQVVQPAAMARFGQPVVEVRSMGSYTCRPMNNQRGNRLSEHSFANALDVGGFVLGDGRTITILKGWKGDLQEQYFLKEVHAGACRHFSTVLGPGADAFHYDHLHMDLAQHGRKANRSICRPYPQAVPPAEPLPYPDPARNLEGSRDAVAGLDVPPPRQTLQPRPAPMPAAPPVAMAESDALARARAVLRPPGLVGAPALQGTSRVPPPPHRRPPASNDVGTPMQLGPFTPQRPEEVDPAELDIITGSVGD